MSRAKAFWLGLGCTLAVLLPIYLAVAAVIFTRSAPADTCLLYTSDAADE